jgi:hypothetical protein
MSTKIKLYLIVSYRRDIKIMYEKTRRPLPTRKMRGNRVGETGLFPVSSSHTTRYTVRYQGGSLLRIQFYDNNPLGTGS